MASSLHSLAGPWKFLLVLFALETTPSKNDTSFVFVFQWKNQHISNNWRLKIIPVPVRICSKRKIADLNRIADNICEKRNVWLDFWNRLQCGVLFCVIRYVQLRKSVCPILVQFHILEFLEKGGKLLFCPWISLNLVALCPWKKEKMSLKLLECPWIWILKICGNHAYAWMWLVDIWTVRLFTVYYLTM